jgi:hypothetical protein
MPTSSDYFDLLEAAITLGHKSPSVHRATVFVHERTKYGLTIWKGNVEVFDLKEHPSAKNCYAWKHDDGERARIYTILGNELIDSAQQAVRAMICADGQPVKLPTGTNGLGLLKEQMEQAGKIIQQMEIRSEELVASMETAMQEQIRLNNARAARMAARE